MTKQPKTYSEACALREVSAQEFYQGSPFPPLTKEPLEGGAIFTFVEYGRLMAVHCHKGEWVKVEGWS